MRLLLACIVIFLAPSGALLIADRYVSAIEDEFSQDAQGHVARLNGVSQFYRPNVAKMRNAPAILQLRQIGPGGGIIAATVCGAPDSPYQRLFDHLRARCDRWTVLRRARRSAILSLALTAGIFAIVLMARIKVQRLIAREEWSGNWAQWFVMRGIPLMLLAHVAVSLIGYGIVLQTIVGKTIYILGILTIPFAVLYWIERRAVLAFVEPQALAAFRPKRAAGPRRRRGLDAAGDTSSVRF